MKATNAAGARSGPAFPIRAVVIGIVAMVAIAVASASTTWIVGKRIRTVTSSQIAVLTTTEQLRHQSEQLELLAQTAIATGDEAFARRYGSLQPKLRGTLQRLRSAIQLPENRASFAVVEAAEREISAIEYHALDLAVADQRDAARALLEDPRYSRLVRTYRSGLLAIEARSRAYVNSTREEMNAYLTINFATSMVALLLIGLAWLVLVRPARAWAKQLGQARRRAESATAAKSDFLAVMSHEVRTPLNSVIGFADLLLADPQVQGEQRRQVELIQGAGTMLLTVVNDLLDFSKIEAGRIELVPEPFALETFIDNSVSIVRSSAETKGLEMRVEVDPCLSPYFLGDESRLRQVLLNLLNNAIKFTSEGLVALAVAKVGESGDSERIRFTVTDTGLGIDPERQQQLFQPFTQADASITRRYGGTGLGLSISKRLVELMGGEIGLESLAGSGSSFWFTVTLPRSSKPELLHGGSSGAGLAPSSILVVEDLPMNQELARAMLSRAGHRIDIAGDGEEALKAVQEKAYDLVLMDIQMPRMDGVTATRLIRQLPPPVGKVPIVAMTANALPRQVMEFLAAGMNGHIAKPVRQRELDAAIAAALPGRRRSDALASPGPAGSEDEVFHPDVFDGVREMLPPDRLKAHVAELDGQVLALAAADAGADRGWIETSAHKVVSQAGMLGLARLSACARALEDASRDGQPIEAALTQFSTAAADIRDHVLPRLGEPETGSRG